MRGLFSLVTFAAVIAWLVRPQPFPDPTKPIKYVDLVLDNGKSDPIHVRIDQQHVIRTAIVDPLNQSKRDSPSGIVAVAGGIHVYYEDGTADAAAVLRPWGRWKYSENYYIAELSSLESEVRRLLRQQGARGTDLADDPEFWDPDFLDSWMPAHTHP